MLTSARAWAALAPSATATDKSAKASFRRVIVCRPCSVLVMFVVSVLMVMVVLVIVAGGGSANLRGNGFPPLQSRRLSVAIRDQGPATPFCNTPSRPPHRGENR